MKKPFGLYLAYLFQFLIAANIFIALSLGEYSQVFGGVLALGLTLVPALVTRRGNITLPWEINLLVAVSLYIHVMGHVAEYYVTFAPYYDKLAHLVASVTVGLIALFLALLAERRGEVRLTGPAVILFILMSTLAAGTVWEIYEFAVDQVFGTSLQFGNTDTMWDLVVDLVGGAIVAAGAAIVLARGEEDRFDRFFAEPSPGAEPPEIMGDPIDPARTR